MERIYISEYPSDPVCKAAEGCKIKDEFGCGKVARNRHIYQIRICDSVAEECEDDIRNGAYHIDVLLLAFEGEGEILRLIVNFRKPWLYSENPQVFCVFRAGADGVYIIHSASLLGILCAVSISESADLLIYKEADNRCRKHNGDNPKVES
ncbi:unknown [Eubacterium sp. CAG:841]|nr:unknown [Eubacterium sp. CAG:841]